ncbi:PAN domain-containing protein [Mameliella sediminis]|uniref:PAN domain-containing protein n=1 Tax=Mameliella sediminis TaxID=2836866 RepID=UPI001C4840C1|nr:PAN domain-containing protein [Mameliella sediminis]MBV7396817.1 PAN domain-containing protein [Mameliella sediminis]MBY6161847.1 PAN domain-containing protein [Mameliella alba]MBY6170317.1 PAN domain-containing protein [Mameliella alba]MBY6175336.1 PAN domain-containing protein [Mameliella alba]
MTFKSLFASAAVFSVSLVASAQAEELQKCFITPVDQVGFIDTFTSPEDCVEACKQTAGCDSWTFQPHSFDSSMPGQCKLIKGVFKKEDSAKVYCGEM